MKNYNIQNYIRYKDDVETSISNLEGKFYDEYTREELIIKFLPLVENLARKFSTSQQASGVLSILDLIQFGHIGLIKANEEKDHLNLPQLVLFGDYLVKGIMSGYSYFPVRKEYVYGNEKAYNRE